MSLLGCSRDPGPLVTKKHIGNTHSITNKSTPAMQAPLYPSHHALAQWVAVCVCCAARQLYHTLVTQDCGMHLPGQWESKATSSGPRHSS
jgi:hypothetical protein